MTQITIKEDLNQDKINALLNFFKSLGIEGKIENKKVLKSNPKKVKLSIGLWEGYDLNASALREKAWNLG